MAVPVPIPTIEEDETSSTVMIQVIHLLLKVTDRETRARIVKAIIAFFDLDEEVCP